MGLAEESTVGANLLKEREECNILLRTDPHNPRRHLNRGWIHSRLGFPDLAAADAYRALTLLEAVADPDSSEYRARKKIDSAFSHETTGFADSCSDASEAGSVATPDLSEESSDYDDGVFEPVPYEEYEAEIGNTYILLVQSLVQCGCMRDAYEFCVQGLDLPHGVDRTRRNEVLEKLLCMIKRSLVEKRPKYQTEGVSDALDFDPARLDAQGVARRVVYPWNDHEPDRNSPDVIRFLNERLRSVAPKCEVRAVVLPSLHGSSDTTAVSISRANERVSIQLGLFAKEDIAPGETLLRESSMLTATNRLHDDLCDACNGRLPGLGTSTPPVACEGCADTIFCSQKCHDIAQKSYHRAVCGQEGLETIGKDVQDPKDKADYLYLLLLGRAIAMAVTQAVHPLDLPEVKYIWGDFHDLGDDGSPYPNDITQLPSHPPSATLPFSFQLNVLQPMRMLEEMGIDPFASLHLFDTWVLNTLYAKFRGTASGRLSTWDGGPEVCAVHPLWCLANHSCDPNVRWEWGGEITFVARSAEERVEWGPEQERERRRRTAGLGIKRDEEILNHYCDLSLVVKERREWAMGALGGACLCARCEWEAAH
ncbi:hypothetical protein VTO42DRAFT_6700 [Malbranchea cinnamomea]